MKRVIASQAGAWFASGVLAVPLLVGAAGCKVGPSYTAPATSVPSGWRLDTSDALGAADIEWWNGFGDPVLDGLIDEALANNYDVRAAAARVEEFAARVGISRSAAFPQAGYGGEASASQTSGESRGGRDVGDFFQANLNVGWELDLWGRIERLTDAARADLLSARENRRGVVLTLVTAVATSYVGLRSLDEQLLIAERRLESRADSVALFTLQFEKGVISRLELSQVQSEYERTAATIPALRRDIALLENSLSVLLGRAPGPIERGLTIDAMHLPDIPAGLPSDVLQQRPDVLGAEYRLRAANERIGAAIAEYYPRVSLTGALGVASDDLSSLASSSATIYDIAAGVTGPLFTAGRIEGQVEAAEAIERQALNEYLGAVLTALRESEDALVTRSTTREEIASQSRQVEALDTYATLARQRYDNGYVGYLEVLDAERTLFDAELQQVQLRANLYASAIGVYKAFGGGWVDLAETRTVTATESTDESTDGD